MKVTAQQGKDHATSAGVANKQRSGELSVPYADLEGVEKIATGFRAEMFSIHDDDGHAIGEVCTGSGFGTDFITLKWKDRTATVRGIDLLRTWVATFDESAAARLPGGGLS